jgi:hypothetical protein
MNPRNIKKYKEANKIFNKTGSLTKTAKLLSISTNRVRDRLLKYQQYLFSKNIQVIELTPDDCFVNLALASFLPTNIKNTILRNMGASVKIKEVYKAYKNLDILNFKNFGALSYKELNKLFKKYERHCTK